MNFTREEKLSILHALNGILIADDKVTENETKIMNTFLSNFNCSTSDLIEARDMDAKRVVNTVRGMSQDKKEFFKGAVSHMALSEGDDKDLDSRVQRAASVYFTLAK